MSFSSQAELLAFFTRGGVPAVEITVDKPVSVETKAEAKVADPKPKTEPKATPKTAAVEPTAPAATVATAASSPVLDYKVLQAKVFELANASREAATQVSAALGVANFKVFAEEFPERRQEALDAVNAKLAELTEAVA